MSFLLEDEIKNLNIPDDIRDRIKENTTNINGTLVWNFNIEDSFDIFADFVSTEGILDMMEELKNDYIPVPFSTRDKSYEEVKDLWEVLESKGYDDEHGIGSGNVGLSFPDWYKLYQEYSQLLTKRTLEEECDLLDDVNSQALYAGYFNPIIYALKKYHKIK